MPREGHPVHVEHLVQWLGLRAQHLAVGVVPALDGSKGWDVVVKLGGPYFDRAAGKGAASAARTTTNILPVIPAARGTDEAPASPASTSTEE